MTHPLIAALCFLLASAFATPPPPLVDLPGSKWRQRDPYFDRMEKHSGKEPRRLTVHYTGVEKRSTQTLEQKLRILFDYSVRSVDLEPPAPAKPPPPNKKPPKKKKAWGDIPYHFYLDMEGQVAAARDPAYQPDSNTKYNRDGHITIVVEGNSEDGITEKQKTKLFTLMKQLQTNFKIPLSRVGVHKDFAATHCPGKAIIDAVLEYKKREALTIAHILAR